MSEDNSWIAEEKAMKYLALMFLVLSLTSTSSALAGSDWEKLVSKDGQKIVKVDGATKIDLEKALSLLDKDVQFIDARAHSWSSGRVPGAIDLRFPTEAKLLKVAGKTDKLVFYCDCDSGSASCNRAATASAMAISFGYKNVYYFSKFDKWAPAGYPIEKDD
jgi:rhodanese-related sulfurtransferase